MTDRPHCRPDHPWVNIPTRDLVRGVCPVCLRELDGERAARVLRARRALGEPSDD